MIPIECVVRNICAGSMAKRYGIAEGTRLPEPIFEFFYKSDALHDPLVNDDHIRVLGWASVADIAEMKTLTHQVNAVLKPLFANAGMDLVDYKLEFGHAISNPNGPLLLGDEFTPDGCRLWDSETHEKLDKDRFRRDLGQRHRKVPRGRASGSACRCSVRRRAGSRGCAKKSRPAGRLFLRVGLNYFFIVSVLFIDESFAESADIFAESIAAVPAAFAASLAAAPDCIAAVPASFAAIAALSAASFAATAALSAAALAASAAAFPLSPHAVSASANAAATKTDSVHFVSPARLRVR